MSSDLETAAAAADGEHILLESGEAPEFEGRHAYRVLERFELDNRSRGIKTQLTLFEDGFLGVREERRGKRGEELVISLRYLDPKPVLSRFVAKQALRVAFYLMGFGLLAGALVYVTPLPGVVALVGLVPVIASGVALFMFVRRTREQVTFRTAVLTLTANFGCFGSCRTLVPKLVSAIARARKEHAEDKSKELRSEMREHYRLRRIGLLTEEACRAGTQRILGQYR